jgi:hypothetical protein
LSSSVPRGSPISLGRFAKKVGSVAPHVRQKVLVSPGDDSYLLKRSSPHTQRKALARTTARVRNAAPVAFLHIEQWQLTTLPNPSASTSYRIPPHRQLPFTPIVRSPCLLNLIGVELRAPEGGAKRRQMATGSCNALLGSAYRIAC